MLCGVEALRKSLGVTCAEATAVACVIGTTFFIILMLKNLFCLFRFVSVCLLVCVCVRLCVCMRVRSCLSQFISNPRKASLFQRPKLTIESEDDCMRALFSYIFVCFAFCFSCRACKRSLCS